MDGNNGNKSEHTGRQHKTNIVTIKCQFWALMAALNIDPVWNDRTSLETSSIMSWMHKSGFIFLKSAHGLKSVHNIT